MSESKSEITFGRTEMQTGWMGVASRHLLKDRSDFLRGELNNLANEVREDALMPPWGSNMTAEDMMEHMSELAREQFLAMSPMREGGGIS